MPKTIKETLKEELNKRRNALTGGDDANQEQHNDAPTLSGTKLNNKESIATLENAKKITKEAAKMMIDGHSTSNTMINRVRNQGDKGHSM